MMFVPAENSNRTLELLQKVKGFFLEPLADLTGVPLTWVSASTAAEVPPAIPPGKSKSISGSRCLESNVHRHRMFDLREQARQSGSSAYALFAKKSRSFLLFSVAIKTKWQLLGFIEGHLDIPLLKSDAPPFESSHTQSTIDQFPKSQKLDRLLVILQFLSGLLTTELNSIEPAPEDQLPIQKAKAYIEAHLSEKLTIPIIASSVGLSENYFPKLFSRFTGLSLSRFVLDRRLQRARYLLDTSMRNISEVAFECGFESISHFNRSFKKYVNLAPRQYRQNMAALRPAIEIS